MSKEHDSNMDMADILIVDDENANLKLLAEMLGRKGFRVRPSNSPRLAIDSARAQPPRLILLDVRMPEMDGFEVCRHLKQDSLTRDIPIIFISALRDARDRVTGFKAGGVDFISKPFDELEVIARVRTHIDLRNLQLNMEEQVNKGRKEVIESEARFRATFDQAAVGIAHVSPEGRFLRLNDKFCEIVDYSRSELLRVSFQDITHPDDLNEDREQVNRLLKGEIKTYSLEKRYLRKTGNLVWVDLTVSLVRDDAGQPKWFVAVIQDISKKKKAEEILTVFKKTIDASADGAYWVNNTGRLVYVNDAACTGLGYSREELLHLEIFDVDTYLSKETWPRFWADRRKQERLQFESTHRRKDGTTFPVEVTSVYIKVNGREFVNGFARDITERKEAETALLKSEKLARILLNATTDLTHLIDEDGIILDLNHAMTEALGGTRGELIGTCVYDRFSKEAAQARRKVVDQALVDGQPIRYIDFDIPGRVYDVGLYPIWAPEGKKAQAVIFAHDITEQRWTEDALRASEKKLRESYDYLLNLTDALPDMACTISMPERRFAWVNDNITKLGYHREELIGRRTRFIYATEAGFLRLTAALNRTIETGGRTFGLEVAFKKKDGSVFPAEVTVSLFRIDGELVNLIAIIRDISRRKSREHQIKMYQQRLKALAAKLTLSEEAERRRVATALHDNVGQSLTFARLQLASVQEDVADPALGNVLREVSNTLLAAARETRHLIFDINSPVISELGLPAAIKDWMEGNFPRRGIAFELIDHSANGGTLPLSQSMAALLFRHARELLTNVIKHARADRVAVHVQATDDGIEIIVEDNGVGFESTSSVDQMSSGHFGLFSIEEGMADIGGTLQLQSESGKGCRAVLQLPIKDEGSEVQG